jgi:hypothetical protein
LRRLGVGKIRKSVLENGQKEDFIPWKYVQPLGMDLTATKGDVKLTVARDRLKDVRPEYLADILEELSREDRIHVFNALDNKAAAYALGATESRVQRDSRRDKHRTGCTDLREPLPRGDSRNHIDTSAG